MNRTIKAKSQLVSAEWIRSMHPLLAGRPDSEIISFWLRNGNDQNISPNPLFDNRYYEAQSQSKRSYPYIYEFVDQSSGYYRSRTKARLKNPNPLFWASEIWNLYIKKEDSLCAMFANEGIADPLSFYIKCPHWLNLKTSPHFSDYSYKEANHDFKVHGTEKALVHYLKTKDIENRPLYPRTHFRSPYISLSVDRMEGSLVNCLLIACNEDNACEVIEFVSSIYDSSLMGFDVWIFIECRLITSLSAKVQLVATSPKYRDEIRVNICESPETFFSTWKKMIWEVPGLINARNLKFCAFPSNLSLFDDSCRALLRSIRSEYASLDDPFSIRIDESLSSAVLVSTNWIKEGKVISSLKTINSIPSSTSVKKSLEFLGSACTNGTSPISFDIVERDYFWASLTLDDRNSECKPSIPNAKVTGPIGQVQAFNVDHRQQFSLALPFSDSKSLAMEPTQNVLAVIHCFYTDLALQIFQCILPRKSLFFLLITTDSNEKAAILDEYLKAHSFLFEVRVCPNIGRDVGPMLVEARELVKQFPYFLHLHTKKSPHSSLLGGWLEYLLNALIGTPETIDSCLSLLSSDTSLGILCAPHYSDLVNQSINWGYNHMKAMNLLQRLNIRSTSLAPLDFPSSSMFWARSDAISPLFRLGLSYDEFDGESGQVDGTLAHALERILFVVTESEGYERLLVTGSPPISSIGSIAIKTSHKAWKSLYKPCFKNISLTESKGICTTYEKGNIETYNTTVLFDKDIKPRFNILIPTVEPAHVYGGISTALKIAKEIYTEMSSCVDLRIAVTSASVTIEGLEYIQTLFNETPLSLCDQSTCKPHAVVELLRRDHIPLSLRSTDMFFATAWWTAFKAKQLRSAIISYFGHAYKWIYLIQDYESCFNEWSEKYALCDSTYVSGDDSMIPIINSEELTEFMIDRFDMNCAFCLPFELNARIRLKLQDVAKENIILVYARPTVKRNLFYLILSALEIWQYSFPEQAREYRVVFAGEEFDPRLVSTVENCQVYGKLSLDEYASLLNLSAIGISLMLSPHPSYPPLEMASAGIYTITNKYANKNLSNRSSFIHSLKYIEPATLAEKLGCIIHDLAYTANARISRSQKELLGIKDLPLPHKALIYQPAGISRLLIGSHC